MDTIDVATDVESSARPAWAGHLAPTPPMGWNSWNVFKHDVNDTLVRETANALVSSGMRDAGYTYLVIDDCWMARERNAEGDLVPDPERFPRGIAELADYVHDLGLLLGIYSSPGEKTCAGYPGSGGHEEQDARLFASWEVDFLKYDWCYTKGNAQEVLVRMGDALARTGRPILYSVNGGAASRDDPWSWGADYPWALDVVDCWRTSNDIWPSWDQDGTIAENSVMTILDEQGGLEKFARPGRWNDPDMLEVGVEGMSDLESRSHFSLWAMLAAPLIAGNDLRNMTQATLEILTNREVIAVDQDRLGRQGRRIQRRGATEAWARELDGGDLAVLLLNRGTAPTRAAVAASIFGISGKVVTRDLWSGAVEYDVDSIEATLAPRESALFRVSSPRRFRLPRAVV